MSLLNTDFKISCGLTVDREECGKEIMGRKNVLGLSHCCC